MLAISIKILHAVITLVVPAACHVCLCHAKMLLARAIVGMQIIVIAHTTPTKTDATNRLATKTSRQIRSVLHCVVTNWDRVSELCPASAGEQRHLRLVHIRVPSLPALPGTLRRAILLPDSHPCRHFGSCGHAVFAPVWILRQRYANHAGASYGIP